MCPALGRWSFASRSYRRGHVEQQRRVRAGLSASRSRCSADVARAARAPRSNLAATRWRRAPGTTGFRELAQFLDAAVGAVRPRRRYRRRRWRKRRRQHQRRNGLPAVPADELARAIPRSKAAPPPAAPSDSATDRRRTPRPNDSARQDPLHRFARQWRRDRRRCRGRRRRRAAARTTSTVDDASVA